MYLSEEGRVACKKCDFNDLIINVKFDCGDRTGVHITDHFQQADCSGMCHAVSMAADISKEAGSRWLATLITNIMKQYGC